MVKITDIQVRGTLDPNVYSVTVISDVQTGTDAMGNPVWLSFTLRWNKNTPKSVLKDAFVKLYQEWKSDRDEEAAVRTELLKLL